MIEEALTNRSNELCGERASTEQVEMLKSKLGQLVPEWFVQMLLTHPLMGCTFTLSDENDISGVGVEMEWLSADQIISESIDVYPGIIAHIKGYLPIGSCLVGTGDYYYIQTQGKVDPPLLRIPHDSVDDEELIESEIEKVCNTLSEFIQNAEIGS